VAQARVIGSPPMETASIRHSSRRLTSVHTHSVTLRSRRLTPLLVARVDSLEPRGALPWSARTLWHSVPMERTSPSAHSTGPLLPREQFTKSSNGRAAKQRLAEVSGEPAGAPPQARPGGRQSLRTTGAIGNERRPMVLGPSGRVVAIPRI